MTDCGYGCKVALLLFIFIYLIVYDRVALNNGQLTLTTARMRTCIINNSYGAIHKIHDIKTIISREQRPSALNFTPFTNFHRALTQFECVTVRKHFTNYSCDLITKQRAGCHVNVAISGYDPLNRIIIPHTRHLSTFQLTSARTVTNLAIIKMTATSRKIQENFPQLKRINH